MAHEHVLDIIGRIEGTNKSDYGFLECYEPLFAPFRNETFNLLEIGVYQGASLRTWRTYFPNAQIVGLDIEPSCRKYAGDRIAIEIGSQADGELLDRIMAQYSPFIVIDDGSHLAHHIVFSFERIFPGMPDGGVYVLEDAYMHFGSEEHIHRGASNIGCREYFMALSTMLTSKKNPARKTDAMTAYLFDHLDSVTFANGVIILRKRYSPLDAAQKIAIAEALVAESGDPDLDLGLARAVIAFGGPLDRREMIIRNLIAKRGASPETLFRLAEILEQQNRTDEAITALEQASLMDEGWSLIVGRIHVLGRLAWLCLRSGAIEQATRSASKLVELAPYYIDGRRMLVQALERGGRLSEAIEEAKRAAENASDDRRVTEIKADISRMAAKLSQSAG